MFLDNRHCLSRDLMRGIKFFMVIRIYCEFYCTNQANRSLVANEIKFGYLAMRALNCGEMAEHGQ